MYGMGVAVGDYNNDGFPEIFVDVRGQNRLFQNTGKGTFADVTRKSGLFGRQAFSTSAIWFDYDRDGLLDLFVCNYVNCRRNTTFFVAWMKAENRTAPGGVSRGDLLAVSKSRRRDV